MKSLRADSNKMRLGLDVAHHASAAGNGSYKEGDVTRNAGKNANPSRPRPKCSSSASRSYRTHAHPLGASSHSSIFQQREAM